MYRGQAMAILFDLDGVFYRGDEVIPGAAKSPNGHATVRCPTCS